MSLSNPFSRRLYLRIWLAVVGGMAVLTLTVGWAWRIAEDQRPRTTSRLCRPRARWRCATRRQPGAARYGTRQPSEPGEVVEFHIEAENGQIFHPCRWRRASPHGPQRRPTRWPRPERGRILDPAALRLLWLLGIVGLAVAVGCTPSSAASRSGWRPAAQREEVWRGRPGRCACPNKGRTKWPTSHASSMRRPSVWKPWSSRTSRCWPMPARAALALTRIRMGLELMGGQQPSPAFREEILRNIAELDQLVDEIPLASRLDAREADVGTVELVDLIGLAAEECARVDADLDVSASPDSLEVRGVANCCAGPSATCWRTHAATARARSRWWCTAARAAPRCMFATTVGRAAQPARAHLRAFYRLPGASERAGGVGLGLALVRSIAGRHNGTVHCQDRADGDSGACFVLALPLAPSTH